jgi:hypothetical protein
MSIFNLYFVIHPSPLLLFLSTPNAIVYVGPARVSPNAKSSKSLSFNTRAIFGIKPSSSGTAYCYWPDNVCPNSINTDSKRVQALFSVSVSITHRWLAIPVTCNMRPGDRMGFHVDSIHTYNPCTVQNILYIFNYLRNCNLLICCTASPRYHSVPYYMFRTGVLCVLIRL